MEKLLWALGISTFILRILELRRQVEDLSKIETIAAYEGLEITV